MSNNSRQRRHRTRRRRKKKGGWFLRLSVPQKILVCLSIVIVGFAAAATSYVVAKWNKIDQKTIEAKDLVINQEVLQREREETKVDLGSGYLNVALFGVDSRDGSLGEGNRTDCIIVASLNQETKEIKMVSVYRDTLLNLSEGTYQKCNAAYSYGGPLLAINMLNMNLDLDIQKYVTVDFGAVADAIDLLGGVEIEVTSEELPYINQYIPETAASAGKQGVFLSAPGLQLLDGIQATTYARIRSTAGGDFTRTERQRRVIEKMVEKAKTADLVTLNRMIDQIFPQVSTNFTLPEIFKYAAAYSDYTLTGSLGFPEDQYMDTLPGLGSVVVPDTLADNVVKMHEFLYGVTGYVPSSVVNTVSAEITYRANVPSSAPNAYSAQDIVAESPSVNAQSQTGQGGRVTAPDADSTGWSAHESQWSPAVSEQESSSLPENGQVEPDGYSPEGNVPDADPNEAME